MIYLNIIGYEGLYLINSEGVIKGIKSGKILKPGLCREGYLKVSLWKDGVGKTKPIHKLVMNTFCGESKLVVNHINGDKLDNTLDNLEYVTASDNIRHAYRTGLKTPKYKKARQYSIDGVFIKEWRSIKEAEEGLGIKGISLVLSGGRKTAGGYIFKN